MLLRSAEISLLDGLVRRLDFDQVACHSLDDRGKNQRRSKKRCSEERLLVRKEKPETKAKRANLCKHQQPEDRRSHDMTPQAAAVGTRMRLKKSDVSASQPIMITSGPSAQRGP